MPAPTQHEFEQGLQNGDLSNYDLTQLSPEQVDELLMTISVRGMRGETFDLSGSHLHGVNFSGESIHNVNFDGARLSQVNLSGARLNYTHIDQNLISTQMSSSFRNTVFDQVDMSNITLDHGMGLDFSGSTGEVDFTGADLRDSNFQNTTLQGTFDRATMTGADLSNSDLSNSTFNQTDLEDTVFQGSTLRHVTFDRATMTRANLSQCDLTASTFDHTDLQLADVSDSNLTAVKMHGADVSGLQFNDNTQAIGLELDGALDDDQTHANQLQGLRITQEMDLAAHAAQDWDRHLGRETRRKSEIRSRPQREERRDRSKSDPNLRRPDLGDMGGM